MGRACGKSPRKGSGRRHRKESILQASGIEEWERASKPGMGAGIESGLKQEKRNCLLESGGRGRLLQEEDVGGW